MSKLSPPAFLADLYRDLRDRRLLLPAGLLVAALIAVPVLLSESAPPPPAPAAGAGVEATAASPAVLAEEAGIRDYRKRLEALKSKNPFNQRFTGPPPGEGNIEEVTSGGDRPPAAGDPATGGATPADAGDAPSTSSSPTPPRIPAPKEPTHDRWLTYEIDLTFGPAGAVKRYDGVRRMKLLPSRKNPIVAMLSVNEQGTRVAFVLTDDVGSSSGDGRCAPSKKECFFLFLREGEEQRFTVAPDEQSEVSYRLKIRKIRERIIKRPRK